MNDRLKYIGYVRVSSYEQAQRNLSIPSQIEQIQKYAIDNNIEIINIFKEENSAYKWKRAIFNDMINFLKKSKDTAWIIIFKWDRISRNINDFTLIDQIATEKKLDIISISEPLLNSYMWRYMIRDIQNRSVLYSEELSFRIKLWIRKKLQNWWDIWGNTPFWYKRINWTYIKDIEKAKIVQKIFKIYSSWMYWYKNLAEKLKNEVIEEYRSIITPRLIDVVLNTKTYCWKRIKIWNLSKEEYIFWWVDKPWKYEEEYDLNFVYPIITEDLYNKCQEVMKSKFNRNNYTYSRNWIPKVFQCSCGRFMLRDDKKMSKYLKCPKQINSVFTFKCNESYTRLDIIETEIENIIQSILPNNDLIKELKKKIDTEFSKNDQERKNLLFENMKKINELNNKNWELTKSFINNNINKTVLEKSSMFIDEAIINLTNENKLLQNIEETKLIYKKIINFIEYLEFLLNKLKIADVNLKSSQLFNHFFHIVENLKISNKKVLSYQLKAPFHFIKNGDFFIWWS